MMKSFVGYLLFIGSIGIALYAYFDVGYWQTSPSVRASHKWQKEIHRLETQSPKLKTALLLIAKIEQQTTDQQFKPMIDATVSPFKTTPKGVYTLKLQFMPWMEDLKYGFLIQHELFDHNMNKVTEFNVNFEIGKLW